MLVVIIIQTETEAAGAVGSNDTPPPSESKAAFLWAPEGCANGLLRRRQVGQILRPWG